CAAIPETILEAELFGTVKGAFTGATDREGKFEAAHTGTILLDEISETSIPFQAKILRVIQEMEIERIGSTKPIKIDVRVVATTNKSLKNEVRKGRFREDLYYRLNVIPIHIPPLRKRKSDIPSLVRYFVNRYSIEACKKPPIIEQDAIEVLVNYPWYGNVRELENFINRLIVTSNRDIIDKKAVIAALETPVNNDYGTHTAESNEIPTLYEVEKNLILKALELTAGNKIKAAKLLGITQRTIYNKLKKYEEEGIKIQKDGKIIES
ncbi:MAG: sigma 54-interacting transcriptional regulator, partial [bacterium]